MMCIGARERRGARNGHQWMAWHTQRPPVRLRGAVLRDVHVLHGVAMRWQQRTGESRRGVQGKLSIGHRKCVGRGRAILSFLSTGFCHARFVWASLPPWASLPHANVMLHPHSPTFFLCPMGLSNATGVTTP